MIKNAQSIDFRGRALLALCSLATGTWGCASPDDNQPTPVNMATPVDLTPDGDGFIQTPVTVNRYGNLAQDGLFGSNLITLSGKTAVTDLQLQPNDLLLIWQTQGGIMETRDTTAYGSVQGLNGAGRFEFIGVSSVDAVNNTVTLYPFCGGLHNTYTAAQTQIVRVPQYNSLLIGQNATLGGKSWDGQNGGIIAVRVQNTLTLNGKIDASGSGFRGGAVNTKLMLPDSNPDLFYRTYNAAGGGIKGESVIGNQDSYAMVGQYGRGAPINGGGGGNAQLAGGGGGANGDNGATWTGQGVMPLSPAIKQKAWMLDPGYVANNNRFTASSGGGRGGYTYSDAAKDPLTISPEDPAWGADFRRERGGLGGRGLPNDAKGRSFLGGGGGSGDNLKSTGGAGGNGGGVVLLIAGSVTGSGAIRADGSNGGDLPTASGGGGGGGGGVVIVAADSMGALTVSAVGGSGGGQTNTDAKAAGPGGGGGGGYIALPQSRTGAMFTASGGSPGSSRSAALANFPENGATAGGNGVVATLDNAIYGGLPFCSGADLGVTLTVSPTMITGRTEISYTVAVTNQGPSPASGLTVSLTLPATAQIQEAQGDGWTCTISEATMSCTRLSLAAKVSSSLTVSALPPLSVTASLATAQVSADSVDPNLLNNINQASLDITDPLYPRGLGGGLACQLRTAVWARSALGGAARSATALARTAAADAANCAQ